MVRRAANTAQDMIGPNYNRGTNMHLIPLTEEAEIDELEQLQAGTSWIIAAILGAVLIGKLPKPGIPGPNQPKKTINIIRLNSGTKNRQSFLQ